MALDTGPAATENQFPCPTLVACLLPAVGGHSPAGSPSLPQLQGTPGAKVKDREDGGDPSAPTTARRDLRGRARSGEKKRSASSKADCRACAGPGTCCAAVPPPLAPPARALLEEEGGQSGEF